MMISRNDDTYDDNEDVIVIQKSWIVTAVMSFLMLGIGGVVGYSLAFMSFERGARELANQVLADINTTPAVAQAQAQPTPVPVRLDEVSADDDPAIGPEDAPVVIVEFSDFR